MRAPSALNSRSARSCGLAMICETTGAQLPEGRRAEVGRGEEDHLPDVIDRAHRAGRRQQFEQRALDDEPAHAVADQRHVDVALRAVRSDEFRGQRGGQRFARLVQGRKPPHDGHGAERGFVGEGVEIELRGDRLVLLEQRQSGRQVSFELLKPWTKKMARLVGPGVPSSRIGTGMGGLHYTRATRRLGCCQPRHRVARKGIGTPNTTYGASAWMRSC